jgi:hypothetical protein
MGWRLVRRSSVSADVRAESLGKRGVSMHLAVGDMLHASSILATNKECLTVHGIGGVS